MGRRRVRGDSASVSRPKGRSLSAAGLELALKNRSQFSHDRALTVGSSEIGQCLRKIVYSKTGAPPDAHDPGVSGFTVRGDLIENHWSAPLVRAWADSWGGKALYSGQADQITLIGKSVKLSATPDSVCVDLGRDCLAEYGIPDIGESQCVVLELKSFDPRIGVSKLPKEPHVYQLQAQLGLVRASLPHKPDFGAIVYFNASDLFDIRVFPFAFDERVFKSLTKRADYALKLKDPNDALPEGKVRGGCTECQWSKTCLGFVPYALDDPKALDPREVRAVEKLAATVDALSKKEDEVKQARLEAEATLHLKMGELKKRLVQGKNFTVVKRLVAPQRRNDAKKLMELAKSLGATEEQLANCQNMTKEGVSLSIERVS